MKLLFLNLAVLAALVGCDRRVAQAESEESMATESVIVPAGAASDDTDADAVMRSPAGPVAERCAGLDGQVRIDCEAAPAPEQESASQDTTTQDAATNEQDTGMERSPVTYR